MPLSPVATTPPPPRSLALPLLGPRPATRSAQNIERDLHTWLRGLYDLALEPHAVTLPLWCGEDVHEVAVPVLLPHAWLHATYAAGPSQFARSMSGQAGEAARFWEWFVEQPFGAEHPSVRSPEHLHQNIPMVLHSDGGEAYTNYELQVYSLSSLCVHGGESWDGKFILATIPTWRMPTKAIRDAALHRLTSVLAWSFAACVEGVWPTAGPTADLPLTSDHAARAGQQLAAGWRASFIGWKGDRKARVADHKLARTRQTTQCCELCEACIPYSKAPTPMLSYCDFRACAPGP